MDDGLTVSRQVLATRGIKNRGSQVCSWLLGRCCGYLCCCCCRVAAVAAEWVSVAGDELVMRVEVRGGMHRVIVHVSTSTCLRRPAAAAHSWHMAASFCCTAGLRLAMAACHCPICVSCAL